MAISSSPPAGSSSSASSPVYPFPDKNRFFIQIGAIAAAGAFFALIFIALVVIFHKQIARFLDRVVAFMDDYLPKWVLGSLVRDVLTGWSALLKGHFKEALLTLGKVALTVAIAVINPVAFAVSFAVSTVLQAFHVDPLIANLVGALASGGISGGLAAAARSGVTVAQAVGQGIIAGVKSLAIAATKLGVAAAHADPSLADLAGLTMGTIANALTKGVDVTNTTTGQVTHLSGLNALGTTLKTQLLPTLAKELANYGVQKLGAVVGLAPVVSQLAGVTLSHGVGTIASGGASTASTLDALWTGLKSGAVTVGLSMAQQAVGLDPLTGAGAVMTRTLSGAISGALSPGHDVFKGAADAFKQSIGNLNFTPPAPDPEDPKFRANGVWNEPAYTQALAQYEAARPVWTAQALDRTITFTEAIRTHPQGLAGAAEQYATAIFNRDSVESLVNTFGSVQQAITKQLAAGKAKAVTLADGTKATELPLTNDGRVKLAYREEAGRTLLLGVTENDVERVYQEVRVDPKTLQAGMRQGTVTRTLADGSKLTTEIRDGQVTKARLVQGDQRWLLTGDASGNLQMTSSGTVVTGQLVDEASGLHFVFKEGRLQPQVQLETKILLNLPEIRNLGITQLTAADLGAAAEGIHLSTPGISTTPPFTPQQMSEGWARVVTTLSSGAIEILGAGRAARYLQQLTAIGQKLIQQPTATAAERQALLAQETQESLTPQEQQNLTTLVRGKLSETAGMSLQQFMAKAANPATLLNPAQSVEAVAAATVAAGAMAAEDLTHLGEGLKQAGPAFATGHPIQGTWYILQDLGRLSIVIGGAKAMAGALAGGLKVARTAGLAEEIVASGPAAQKGFQAGDLFQGLQNRLAGALGGSQRLTTDVGQMERFKELVRFVDAQGRVREGIAFGSKTGSQIAQEAVTLLQQGKLTANEVATLGRMNVVQSQEALAPALFKALQAQLETGGKTEAVVDALRQSFGVKGASRLFSGEIKTVRFYTDNPEVIQQTGQIVSPKTGKAFFAIQDFSTEAETQQLLAIDHGLTHYVDVPVERIRGQIEVIRRVEGINALGLKGQGLEIVTKGPVAVRDLNLQFVSLKRG